MLSRAGRNACWAVLLATFLASAGLAAPLQNLFAQIRTNEPLRIHGGLDAELARSVDARIHPAPEAAVELTADQLRLRVTERRLPHVLAGGRDVHGSSLDRSSERRLVDATATVVEVGPGAAIASLGEGSLLLAAADCQLWPSRGPGLDITGRRGLLPTVTVDCVAERHEHRGTVRWTLSNLTVELHHTDPETGERRSERVRAGNWTERDRRVPGLEQHVSQRVELWTYDGLVESVSAGRLRFQAATIAVSGSLTIPPFVGRLAWDDRTINASQEQVHANGAFLIETAPRHDFVVSGIALSPDGPRAPARSVPSISLAIAAIASALLVGAASWILAARAERSNPLAHPTRRKIVELLRRRPGMSIEAISSEVGIARGTATHHLARLSRARLLASRRHGRELCYFLPADLARQAPPLSRNPHHQRLLEALNENPDAIQDELAERLGLSQSYVSRLLTRLKGLGHIAPRRERRLQAPTAPSLPAEPAPGGPAAADS